MQHLAELCALMVELNFGELAARIFTTLADHGAASYTTLRELTKIPFSRLNIGLSVLSQYHIILHSGSQYEYSSFQVDWHAAYSLVRTDKIKRLVGERHGDLASILINDMIHLGLASVEELVAVYANNPEPKTNGELEHGHDASGKAMPNGTKKRKQGESKQIASASQVHKVLTTLLEHGFLVKVGSRSFLPHADLQQNLRDTVVATSFPDGKITGPKKQKAFNLELNILKRKWQDEDEFSSNRDVVSQPNKRLKTGASSSKRSKVNGDVVNGVNHYDEDDEDKSKLPIDMLLRVNFNKCTIALRSQRLEKTAGRFLGPVTAAVYGALLRVLERKEKASRDVYKIEYDDAEEEEEGGTNDDEDDGDRDDNVRLPSAYDWEVLDALDPGLDLAVQAPDVNDSSGPVNGSRPNGNHHTHLTNGVDDTAGSDTEDDEGGDVSIPHRQRRKRQELVAAHLQLLSEHPKDFCIRMFGGGRTAVDIRSLTNSLIQDDVDATIASRHGQVAGRIVRLLRANGKLEEKQLSALSLKRVKDVRAILANLQAFTLVDVQELPKDAQRQPQRSSYFWFFDEARVRDLFLQHTYKSMTRLLQRIQTERQSDAFRAAVDKAERVDVKGREEKLLARHERNIVKQWRDVEERLLIQLGRLDDVVALLRDFGGKDTSLDT